MRNCKSLFIPLIGNSSAYVCRKFMFGWIQSVGGLDFVLSESSDSHPGRSRNIIAAQFLKSDKEFLLFWDADILATKADIEKLCEHDDLILAGIYCKKQITITPEPVINTLGTENMPITGQLERIKRAGTGFLRIHRSVFETIKDPKNLPILRTLNICELEYENHGEKQWDFFSSGVTNKEWLSEDWRFCDVARSLGFEIMLHTGIQLYHVGECSYPVDLSPVLAGATDAQLAQLGVKRDIIEVPQLKSA